MVIVCQPRQPMLHPSVLPGCVAQSHLRLSKQSCLHHSSRPSTVKESHLFSTPEPLGNDPLSYRCRSILEAEALSYVFPSLLYALNLSSYSRLYLDLLNHPLCRVTFKMKHDVILQYTNLKNILFRQCQMT